MKGGDSPLTTRKIKDTHSIGERTKYVFIGRGGWPPHTWSHLTWREKALPLVPSFRVCYATIILWLHCALGKTALTWLYDLRKRLANCIAKHCLYSAASMHATKQCSREMMQGNYKATAAGKSVVGLFRTTNALANQCICSQDTLP